MQARSWRRIFKALAVVAVLIGVGALAIHVSLPAVVRWQVRSALARMGYRNATFTVESASAYGARIRDIRAGEKGQLSVSSLQVDYAPLRAAMGRIDTLRVDRANVTIDLDSAVSTGETEFDLWSTLNPQGLPLWRIELTDTRLTLRRGQREYTMQADGWLWREQADRARASLSLRFASAPAWLEGNMRFDSRSFDFTFSAAEVDLAAIRPFLSIEVRETITDISGQFFTVVSMQYADQKTLAQAQIKLNDGRIVTSDDLGVTLEGVSTDLVIDSLQPLRARPGQHINVKKLSMGEHAIENLHVELGLDDVAALTVDSLRFNWAGGEIRTAGPAVVNIQQRSTALTVAIDRVGLGEFLRIVSDGKASGDGTLSGELPIRIEWPFVRFGNGRIASDGPGNIDFGEKVGEMAADIAQRDPRLKGQGDQLMAALANFHYDQIVFEFRLTETGLEVANRLVGRGTKGTKTPLDVTIRHVGLEDALNTYLATKLGVRSSGN